MTKQSSYLRGQAGQQSVNSQSTVSQRSVNSQSTVSQRSVNGQSTVSQQSVNSQPTVNSQSVGSHKPVPQPVHSPSKMALWQRLHRLSICHSTSLFWQALRISWRAAASLATLTRRPSNASSAFAKSLAPLRSASRPSADTCLCDSTSFLRDLASRWFETRA